MTYITPEQLAKSAILSLELNLKAISPKNSITTSTQKTPTQDPAEHHTNMDEVAPGEPPEISPTRAPTYISPEQLAKAAIRSLELNLKNGRPAQSNDHPVAKKFMVHLRGERK